jgi:hypothetical protein
MATRLPLRRLPGVRFELPPAAPDDALPRMDIALFVGFSGCGPLTAPVAVESLAEFEAVFGEGIALARDAVHGAPVHGLLHPAVRGFFSQGGRRCWVLRVAGSGARTSRFPLPGLLCGRRRGAGEPWRYQPAALFARSPGSGADAMQVAARVQAVPSRARLLPAPGDGLLAIETAVAAAFAPRAGDVVRIALGDLHLHARAVSAAQQSSAAGTAMQRVECAGLVALRRMSDTGSPAVTPVAVALQDQEDGAEARPATGAWQGDGRLAVTVRLAAGWLPRRGDIARLDFAGGTTGWMALDSVEPGQPMDAAGGGIDVALLGAPWQEANGDIDAALDDWRASGAARIAHWLRLGLRVQTGPRSAALLDGLAMGSTPAGQAVAAGVFDLPDDEQMFAYRDGTADTDTPRDARSPLQDRFPLAAGPEDGERMLLPLAGLDDFDAALGPSGATTCALERDGLAEFHWSLFGEVALAGWSSDALAGQAEAMANAGNKPRALRGMHALFGAGPQGFAGEPTLLAVPDAVHAGWRPIAQPVSPWTELPPQPEPDRPDADGAFADCAAVPLAPPRFVRGADPLPDGRFTLYWSGPAAPAEYELQEAADPGFDSGIPVYSGALARHEISGREPGVAFFRVRARAGARVSPWSQTVRIDTVAQGYETVPWEPAGLLAIHRLILRTAAGRRDMLAVLAMPAHADVAECAAYAAALRSTRADRAADAAGPAAIGDDELRALSHGALYHPWLTIRREEELIAFPPDGAVCGQLAAVALERGAWIAAAHRPLRDVVALGAPGMRPTTEQRQRMFDSQVNLVRSAPDGFIIASADTLTPEADWRPINVRRLMCLLHRLAMRRGHTYVFEPAGDTLRRTVERSFEAALDGLFRRGAFAGERAELAYQVKVDERIDTAQRRDMGQFWIELKVAPAVPMSFLTVRLARIGERVLSQESR